MLEQNGLNNNEINNNVTDNNVTGCNGMNAPMMNSNPMMNGMQNSGVMTGYPAYVYQKPKPVYGKAETIISPLVFLAALLYVRFIVFNMTGIISTLIYIGIITMSIIYLKKKGNYLSRIY